jgi:hypothetical protein
MFWKDEIDKRDLGSGRHQKDPQAPGIMGSERQTPSPDDRDADPSHQAPYRLFRLPDPPSDRTAYSLSLIQKQASCLADGVVYRHEFSFQPTL